MKESFNGCGVRMIGLRTQTYTHRERQTKLAHLFNLLGKLWEFNN